MRVLGEEIVTADNDALLVYARPDGLGIYQDLVIYAAQQDRWLAVLGQIAEIESRMYAVNVDDDHIIVTFTAASGRWTRTPFHVDAMWAAIPAKKAAKKKAVKKTAKKT